MKLSEIKGDRVFDVIADLIDPIANIADDPEASALFQKRQLPEGMSTRDFGVEWLKDASTKLLKKHKKDCIAIMSTLEGVSEKKYKEDLTLIKLISDVSDLVADEAFRELFFSTAKTAPQDASGSASENTEE